MENIKLCPAAFDDKAILGYDWIETFFDTFKGVFASNKTHDIFVGFIEGDWEIRVSLIGNSITIFFVQGKPCWRLINRIIKFFSVDEQDDNMPFTSIDWVSDNDRMITIQYYFKPNKQ